MTVFVIIILVAARTDLLVRLLQVLHEHGDDDVDEDELSHQHEHDEEERSEVWRDTAVSGGVGEFKLSPEPQVGGEFRLPEALVSLFALLSESVLHDAVPVVPRGDPEQGEKGHPERAKVSVFSKTLARVVVVAFW